jgi:hypothetical protein
MELRQTGDQVEGEYGWDVGKIKGILSKEGNNYVLTGEWSEAPTYLPPGDKGKFKFVFVTPNRFEGTWNSGDAEPVPYPAPNSMYNWTGTR